MRNFKHGVMAVVFLFCALSFAASTAKGDFKLLAEMLIAFILICVLVAATVLDSLSKS